MAFLRGENFFLEIDLTPCVAQIQEFYAYKQALVTKYSDNSKELFLLFNFFEELFVTKTFLCSHFAIEIKFSFFKSPNITCSISKGKKLFLRRAKTSFINIGSSCEKMLPRK
jgi:hypothetical protein